MNRLQEFRLERGLTQPDVSAHLKTVESRADVGMVSRYEKGVCLPTPAQLAVLEDTLQASRFELFDPEDIDLMPSMVSVTEGAEDKKTATAERKPDTRYRK